jgi:hypothetical protein
MFLGVSHSQLVYLSWPILAIIEHQSLLAGNIRSAAWSRQENLFLWPKIPA